MTSGSSALSHMILRVRMRAFVRRLLSYLIVIAMAFSPLTHAVMNSSIGPDNAGRMKMDNHSHHGDPTVAVEVAGTSLDREGVPTHCNQLSESGACMLLCSACLSAINQPHDGLPETQRSSTWPQNYAVLNLLVYANPPLKPPRR